ncbi:MAG: iron-regulated protein [Curvibacter sp. RIFCSPHIGHO2_12_FULL_63_18]|uniref:imelysin family protein n=1 Tax=Rhodoferax sp. TaxID=50421 RepID=UPI0008C12C61|nr:imelysin family protein [Rhodoferax sp.]OGO99033.1 MAG: iron-regulated protein [Curvibacter sp. GWA2_63_95]OGP01296.1 MAG: iron-regulated protein [Curvibacter sp. RIFCSPHIGHO2_12_FULL_63_18]HCX82167.1 iron-regulated protein [Rhodoferax sp.]
MQKRHFLTATLLGAALLAGLPAQAQSVDAKAVVQHYATLVHANYSDVLTSAQTLQKAITAFAAAPSAQGLEDAKKAWLAAREFYGQTEVFRFYSGPIDDDNGPEGRINAWPLDESYIDSVTSKPKAGLVNNPKVKITKANLAKLNERGGEENIAAGWHAIEFSLWGQDQSDTGPGSRSFEDFVDGKAANADRRRAYLVTATELLIDDLSFLVKAWTPGAKNYRARFEQGGIQSVRKMIVGMGSLSRGELAGERLEVAMNTQDKEDEHSCFSDNTHRDVVTNAQGIENVWLGSYKRLDGSTLQGASLKDLVAAKNAGLADKVSKQIAQSVANATAIQAPFDREIVGAKDAPGRIRVQKTIDSLVQQSKDITEAAAALGITKLAQAK